MLWKPIETAPKDRRDLLGYWPAGTLFSNDAVECAHWDDDRHNRKPRPYWAGPRQDVALLRKHPPTHWTVIPVPPNAVGLNLNGYSASLHVKRVLSKDLSVLDELSRDTHKGDVEIIVCAFDTGWLLQLQYEDSTDEQVNAAILNCYRVRGLSSTLMKVLEEAQKAGIAFLRIHQDA